MHRILIYAAFGWLAFSGTLHFLIDVVSPSGRGQRVPGPETTLYYGLNSAFALGQVVFALFGLWVAWRAPAVLDARPVMGLALAAAAGWLTITFAFMGYWEPKFNAAVFSVRIIGAVVTA